MNTLKMNNSLLLIVAVICMTACTSGQKAGQVITGRIWTGNDQQPWAEAMAICGDTILAIGTIEDIKPFIGQKTNRINTDTSQLIVPGFIDCHTHFIDGGTRLAGVKLRDAKTPEEFIRRIADFAKTVPDGTWITGGDWDHQNWGGQLPRKEWIDSVTPHHPVWVTRLDGHMGLANTAALQAAHINNDISDVAGGEIVRDKHTLTGLMKDNAKKLILKAITIPSDEVLDAILDSAMHYVASHGVTSIHSLTGTGFSDYIDVYKRAHDQRRLITRIYAATSLDHWQQMAAQVKQHGNGDKWLRVGLLKILVDGSLGSHTAAFMHPFDDSPRDSGFFVLSPDSLYHAIKAADQAGLHLAVHAIGDRSIHQLLNIFEQVEKENGPKDRRFRMEHAQHIAPEDMTRFAQLGIIASMQPYHAIDDGRWAEKFIGHERAKTTYAFKALLDAKATVAFGSDWFVAPADPIVGIYAAVSRRTLDGKNPDGWIPEQKITAEQALKAYTIDAARSSFEESIKGSLEPGKLADYVVLGKNIFQAAPETIDQIPVMKTVVGGKTVYSQP